MPENEPGVKTAAERVTSVTPTISALAALDANSMVTNSAAQAIETASDSSDTKTINSEINLNSARDAMRALLTAA